MIFLETISCRRTNSGVKKKCMSGILHVAWICIGGYILCYIDYLGTPERKANKNRVLEPIAKRFKISSKHLHCGSYACVYQAVNVNENGMPNNTRKTYVVKRQRKNNVWKKQGHTLHAEAVMYRALQGGSGVANTYGYEEDLKAETLVMDMLGSSLRNLFSIKCHGKFSLKTVLMLAEQMISRIQFIHSRGFVHGDVTLLNFAIGSPGSINQSTIFTVDFNLACRWRNFTAPEVESYKRKNRENGIFLDVKFIPWCKTYGRKEDLLNVGLQLLTLVGLRKFHRWTKEALSSHDVMKLKTKLYRRKLPMVFIEYIKQNKKLKINNNPNYEGLKMMFRKTAKKLHITYPYDYKFDKCIRNSIASKNP